MNIKTKNRIKFIGYTLAQVVIVGCATLLGTGFGMLVGSVADDKLQELSARKNNLKEQR